MGWKLNPSGTFPRNISEILIQSSQCGEDSMVSRSPRHLKYFGTRSFIRCGGSASIPTGTYLRFWGKKILLKYTYSEEFIRRHNFSWRIRNSVRWWWWWSVTSGFSALSPWVKFGLSFFIFFNPLKFIFFEKF